VSKDPEITSIREVRGKDGSTGYLVEGGQGSEGVSFHVSKETMHALEKEGTQTLKDTLKRQIETSLIGQRSQE
jgi:hypothetical protein